MKPLRSLLDKFAHSFERGGKYERLYPVYEALDTFLYTPGETTQRPAHVRDAIDLKRMMSIVVVALIPCIFMAFWNTGYQANAAIAAHGSDGMVLSSEWRASVYEALGFGYDPHSFLGNIVLGGLFFLPAYIVTMAVGGAWEALFSIVRRHEINEGFLVTGMLFPLTLPPTTPLWQVAMGISFGVVVGKEIFGGTGKNFLNPALTARAYLYFAHPADLTGDDVWTAVKSANPIDSWSGATTLGVLQVGAPDEVSETLTSGWWWNSFLGVVPGSMGETSVLACLIGAAVLIATGVGSWRIMLGVVFGAVAMSAVFYSIGSETNAMWLMSPDWHLIIGGFMFGTVFMATDPVSASMTQGGKWIYGALIGVLTVLIRVANPAYPEGIMLAILFGNVAAPLIDYFFVQANIKRRAARNAS